MERWLWGFNGTAGQWTLYKESGDIVQIGGPPDIDPTKGPMAMIAAAPDLLEALTDTLRMFGFMKSVINSGEDWSDQLDREYRAACTKVDTALRRARGKDQP